MRSFGVARNLKEDPNESNIDRLLNGTQADVENRVKERDVLKRLRSLRVQRFNTVAKCLGILLNTRTLNIAIYGRSLVRTMVCHSAHRYNKKNQAAHDSFLEGLDHVQEIVDIYKEDNVSAYRLNAAEELEELAVFEELKLSSTSAVQEKAAKIRKDRKAAISSLNYSIIRGLKNIDIVNDAQTLYELVYQSDDYFDKCDGSLEAAVDLHLQKMDKALEGQNWAQTTGDTQLLMAWLEKVQGTFRAVGI